MGKNRGCRKPAERNRKQAKASPALPWPFSHFNSLPQSLELLLAQSPAVRHDEQLAAAWLQDIDRWCKQQSQQIEDMMVGYDPLDLIAALCWHQTMVDPETFKEATHGGFHFVVEYAALLCLKHEYTPANKPITPELLLQLSSAISHLYTAVNFRNGVTHSNKSDSKQLDIGDIVHRGLAEELMVRGPGYEHHLRTDVNRLFEPCEAWIRENLGWAVPDLLAIEDSVRALGSRRLAARWQQVRQAMPNMERDPSRKHKATGRPHRSAKQKAATEHWAALSWILTFMSASLGFTVDDLAEESKLPVSTIVSALNFFSLEFSSVPPEFYLPEPVHALKERPLIHKGGKYLYPVVGSLLWGVQKRLETEFKEFGRRTGSDAVWNSYEKKRGQYLECEALRLLAGTLQTHEVYDNLVYYIADDNGRRIKAELDGLIVFDQTLLLIEAKGGGLHIRSRRGELGRLKGDVRDLISKAHQQALRAKSYIENTPAPVFYQDKKEIALDRGRFQRIILVTVTLENVDFLNATLHHLVDTGLMQDTTLPWAVSLDILRVICDVNEFPSQLIHYLQQRLKLATWKNLNTHDELDWFGLYLNRGLYFEGEPELATSNQVYIQSFSGMFDDYYAHQLGQRKQPAPKPRQPLPPLLREIILELESKGPGSSEAILHLLDLGDQARTGIDSGFQRIRSLTSKDGQTHDFSAVADGEGTTLLSCTVAGFAAAVQRLQVYTYAKKYQQRASRWLGLVTVVNCEELVNHCVLWDEPWREDENLEPLILGLPDQRLAFKS